MASLASVLTQREAYRWLLHRLFDGGPKLELLAVAPEVPVAPAVVSQVGGSVQARRRRVRHPKGGGAHGTT
jgi:hypothetical protein